ncbi:hypothetical protein Lfu02_01370 [Longispora fulva]|uniref:Putative membrane protein n=1 Tax=Longispora fulva TaxID=619741 RepID=A0A8J7G940_9ACTN|nr:DUF202 domain-containing protein [Longispora fulva]MBG6135993.1 putative membrane protein [Longispora fulva]GIG55765.1 hypothetical protein Lfu02_01370 [Longispora fulva]
MTRVPPRWVTPGRLTRVGTTPDYRFTLANERTFLAWIRTALALVGGGIAAERTHLAPRWLVVALLVCGAVVACRALWRWMRCELAIRLGRELPAAHFHTIVAVTVAAAALTGLVLALVPA